MDVAAILEDVAGESTLAMPWNAALEYSETTFIHFCPGAALSATGTDLHIAGLTDCRTIVFPEIGYGFVIRNQPPGQPHRFNIAPGFTFKPSA